MGRDYGVECVCVGGGGGGKRVGGWGGICMSSLSNQKQENQIMRKRLVNASV